MPVEPMQAVSDAIAESNNELAGFNQTRVTAVIVEGQTIWPVESVLDWPAAGMILARGVLYSYTSRSDTAVEGISHTDGETVILGAAAQIPEEHLITDVTRLTSAVELLRAALFVDTAESNDLDVVGRNLGVNRIPTISSDDIFREIVKALAYNPRGTIFGIELFLTAALGAGNFEIIEDLIEEPNKIKVKLLAGASTTADFEGKAFLTGQENQAEVSATTLNISAAVIANGVVHGVRFKDENHESDFRAAKPSVETLVEYIGDAGTQLWNYVGPSEAADVALINSTTSQESGEALVTGEAIEITDGSAADVAHYEHPARIQPESDARLEVVVYVDSTGTILTTSTSMSQLGAEIHDGAFEVAWGIREVSTDASKFEIAFRNANLILGSVIRRLDKDTYYAIELRKFGQDYVQLVVDGEVIATRDYSTFTTATTDTVMKFGAFRVTAINVIMRVKRATYFATTPTDYWGGRGIAGSVTGTGLIDRDINVGLGDAIFLAVTDDNKRFDVRGGTAANPEGGTNNGIFEVDTVVSAQIVTLRGPLQSAAFVESANPTVFNASDRVFQYPDDLGKIINIATGGPNDGDHVITQLIDADDGVTDLESRDTRHPEKTDTAIVGAASFVTATGIAWRLNPDFVTEASLEWEISDVGTEAALLITLRQALPTLAASVAITLVLSVAFSEVLSAQILPDLTVRNLLTDAGPPRVYSHYPFYLSDSLGFIRFYLDLITAAGVIPELGE